MRPDVGGEDLRGEDELDRAKGESKEGDKSADHRDDQGATRIACQEHQANAGQAGNSADGANLEQKAVLKKLRPDLVKAETLAGDAIQAKLTEAPGNGESIGGLKVVTGKGWFAARPSGTEDIYKIYAESFEGADHLRKIQDEARTIVADAFKAAGV